MIGGKGDTEIRGYPLKQPKAPCRVWRPGPDGQLVLVDADWSPPVKKKRSGREVYRDGMLGRSRSSRSWFDSPEGDF